MDIKRWGIHGMIAFALFANVGSVAAAEPASREGTTPPRLSFLDGEVSFWRPGNEDWTAARLNTAVAPGDALYTGPGGKLEMQIGARAYLRADGGTDMALETQEPDYMMFKVTAGRVAFDIRQLRPSETMEIGTPTAAFSIDQPGYYRLEVASGSARFIARRGGHARVTPAGGQTSDVAPTQEVVIEGNESPTLSASAAPELDDWDQWNYARTDQLLAATSRHYVPEEVYGSEALDRYGQWRVEPTYGRVWVPDVPQTWAPYSTGQWASDPYYGWTWVDDAPWGWAPYHYGRWIYAQNYWAWAPGPLVVAPLYAPALVAFFGGSGFQIGFDIGVPAVSWVALGWGEPCLPWWGGVDFVGRPWWGGWHGPHVVNNTFIDNSTHITNIYSNTRVRGGVVGVPRDRFGNGSVDRVRLARLEQHTLTPLRDAMPRRPDAVNRMPVREHLGPHDAIFSKPVVSARAPGRRDRSAVASLRPDRFQPQEMHPRNNSASPSAPNVRTDMPRRSPPLPSRRDTQSRQLDPRRPAERSSDPRAARLAPPPHHSVTTAPNRRELHTAAIDPQRQLPPRVEAGRRNSEVRRDMERRTNTNVPRFSPPPHPLQGTLGRDAASARRGTMDQRQALAHRFEGNGSPAARDFAPRRPEPRTPQFQAPPRANPQMVQRGNPFPPAAREHPSLPQHFAAPRDSAPRRPEPPAPQFQAPPRPNPQMVQRGNPFPSAARERPSMPQHFAAPRDSAPRRPEPAAPQFQAPPRANPQMIQRSNPFPSAVGERPSMPQQFAAPRAAAPVMPRGGGGGISSFGGNGGTSNGDNRRHVR